MRITNSIRVLVLFAISGLMGCLPETSKFTVVSRPEDKPPKVVSNELIDGKIEYLKRVLKEKDLSNSQKQSAESLLDTYEKLRINPQNPSDYPQIIQSLFSDLDQLDKAYFSERIQKDRPFTLAAQQLSLKRKALMDDFLKANYQGVIDRSLAIETSFGPDALTPDIGILFAVSLAKKGMIREAESIGEKVARKMEGTPDLINLRASLVEWQYKLGKKDRARLTYEKLIDTIDERQSLTGRAERIISEGLEAVKSVPGEAVASKDDQSSQELDPLEKSLKEVERLVHLHEFQKAKLLLLRLRIKLQGEGDLETIDQAMKSVEIAEKKYGEQRQSVETRRNESIDLAKILIEAEKFEEAISALEDMEQDPNLESQFKELRELAVEKIIQRERNRAAKLFLLAKENSDPEKKKELLLSSQQILNNLIKKYPTSPSNKRINNNLDAIYRELSQLD